MKRLLPLTIVLALSSSSARAAAIDPDVTVVELTLGGSGLPPGPLDSYSNEDPKTRGIFIHQVLWQLLGQSQIPANAVIQEVRVMRVSSGSFSPGVLPATMRVALSNGVDVLQVPSATLGEPAPADPLEVYGVNAYVTGGGNVFAVNPFTGQPWQRADLDTLYAGFWARWENTSVTPVSTQHLSFSEFTVEVVFQRTVLTFTGTNPLNLSTGDTGRYLTTVGVPSTATYSPAFTIGSATNPHSDCDDVDVRDAFRRGRGQHWRHGSTGRLQCHRGGRAGGCGRDAEHQRGNGGRATAGHDSDHHRRGRRPTR